MTFFIYCEYIFTHYWDTNSYTKRKQGRKTERAICEGEYEAAKQAHDYYAANK